jgi:hypothetical protein
VPSATAEQILAFRLARSGLAGELTRDLAAAASCPASDFSRDAALLALAARAEGVTRERFERAVDGGEIALAHVIRGAIHAVAPQDLGLYGRALVGRDERELAAQLGRRAGAPLVDALDEVTAAVTDALRGGPLGKNELHAALRERVREDLLPWCPGCESHHVAPSLWRYAAIKAGTRLDGARRYRLAEPLPDREPHDAVRRFLHFYGPATAVDFGAWAGVTPSHARRLWDEVAAELIEVDGFGMLAAADADALAAPPAARGVHLLPPGDPYLQKPNRELLAPDAELRKRMFRPVASPGAVLQDGRLAGLWRAKRKGRAIEVEVERLGRIDDGELEAAAATVAALHDAELRLR